MFWCASYVQVSVADSGAGPTRVSMLPALL
jgi:hypothetical protein